MDKQSVCIMADIKSNTFTSETGTHTHTHTAFHAISNGQGDPFEVIYCAHTFVNNDK